MTPSDLRDILMWLDTPEQTYTVCADGTVEWHVPGQPPDYAAALTDADFLAWRLTRAREAAHAVRRAERSARETGGFAHAGHRFDSDRDSLHRLGLMLPAAYAAVAADGAATVLVPTGWRDTEGVPRLYTAEDILGAHQALLANGLACDGASQAIAADIEAAASVAAVEAIAATIGADPRWPGGA